MLTFEEYAAIATWYARVENSIVMEVLSNFSEEGEQPPVPEGENYIGFDFSDGVQIGWGYDGTNFFPIADPVITTVDFVELFTAEEFMTIEALLGVDPITTQLYKVAELQGTVDMSSEKVTQIALPNFVTLGVMTQERADEILNSWQDS